MKSSMDSRQSFLRSDKWTRALSITSKCDMVCVSLGIMFVLMGGISMCFAVAEEAPEELWYVILGLFGVLALMLFFLYVPIATMRNKYRYAFIKKMSVINQIVRGVIAVVVILSTRPYYQALMSGAAGDRGEMEIVLFLLLRSFYLFTVFLPMLYILFAYLSEKSLIYENMKAEFN